MVVDRFRGDLVLLDSNRGGDAGGGDDMGGGYGGGYGGGSGGGSYSAPARSQPQRTERPATGGGGNGGGWDAPAGGSDLDDEIPF